MAWKFSGADKKVQIYLLIFLPLETSGTIRAKSNNANMKLLYLLGCTWWTHKIDLVAIGLCLVGQVTLNKLSLVMLNQSR